MEHYSAIRDDAFFAVYLENCRIGHLILDRQFHILFANKRMFEYFHLTPRNLDSLSFGQAFHCSKLGADCAVCGDGASGACSILHAMKMIQKGGIIDSDTVSYSFFHAGRPKTKWFQMNGCAIPYKNENLISLIFTDITDMKQREKRLKKLLSLDLATGTINKYSLLAALRKRTKSEKKFGKFSLSLIDFDNFKSLNDQYGHLFGDKVLEKFSDIAHRHIRKNDILGRYGGEEFIFIFDEIDERQSLKILKRIQTELEGYFMNSSGVEVTFSAGIVTVLSGSPRLSHTELIRKADAMLYEAKRRGRAKAMSCRGESPLSRRKA
jgi:diguanylate cyclase (GGDEF)-like protein